MNHIEMITNHELETVTGGSAVSRCIAGASLTTFPSAMLGAAAGSVVPGVGTVVGAGVGALVGAAAGCATGMAATP
jgi:hypothetical protein